MPTLKLVIYQPYTQNTYIVANLKTNLAIQSKLKICKHDSPLQLLLTNKEPLTEAFGTFETTFLCSTRI